MDGRYYQEGPKPASRANGDIADADAVRLSELFRELDDKASDAGIIEWALRQPSMEEVFLKIARASEVELQEKLKQEETQKKRPRTFHV